MFCANNFLPQFSSCLCHFFVSFCGIELRKPGNGSTWDYYCLCCYLLFKCLHFSSHLLKRNLYILFSTGAFAGNSRKFRTEFLQDFPTPGTGPYFDTTVSSNVTGLVGKTVHLICKVKNLGNRTVSKSFLLPFTSCWIINFYSISCALLSKCSSQWYIICMHSHTTHML